MKTVFFVDDDIFVTQLYSNLLKNEGLQIRTANGGREAIERLPVIEPDLVVLDLHMPEVSGVEVLRFLRSSKYLKDLPVVVFSHGYVQSLQEEMGELHVDKTLSKLLCPPRQLVQEVKELLAEQHSGAPAGKKGLSPLAAAATHVPKETMEELPTWLGRLHKEKHPKARRVSVIHIYRILQDTLEWALNADASTPRGKLGRALMQLLNDLYAHPDHVTETTMGVLSQGVQKLFGFSTKAKQVKLESEGMLMELLGEI